MEVGGSYFHFLFMEVFMKTFLIFFLGVSITLNLSVLLFFYLLYKKRTREENDDKMLKNYKENWGKFWNE